MASRTPKRAIKEFCLQCVCGVREEAENCTDTKCPLYTYRLGRDRLAKPMTEAQKAAGVRGAENLKAYRSKKGAL